MTNITQLIRDLRILNYTQNEANKLVATHLSNGTLEKLGDTIKKQLKELAEKRYT
jgi:hypothetical protein